jgi:outer membrane protein OmpA-like peptidoglycan-associated protein
MVDQKAGLATDAVLSPPDKPYEEAYRQLRDELLAAHNAATSTAVGQRDYDGLRAILRERAGILGAYKLAGLPDLLSDSDFTPESSAVLAVFEGVVAQRLLNIDPDRRALHYLDNLQVVQKLAVCSSADLREHVEAFWVASSRFNSRFLHGDCEEFLDAFAERDIILPFLSESFETQDSINISGKYEAIDDAVTLQVNQAGRYLLGWLQYHQREKYRLRGHYLDHDTGRISFRYLLINQSNDEIERTGVLNAVMIDGKPEITLGTVVDIGLGPDLREDTFLQTSNYPPLSPETIELFAGDGRDILLSHQLVPLHSLEVAFFYTKTPEIRTKITAFAQLPDGDINRNLRASETDALIGEILGGVDSASTALVRLALLQELSTDTVNDRTLREWLMIMVTVKAQANEPMTNAMALLGQVERISDNSDGSPSTGGLFRYEFSFEEISGGGDLGPIAVGGTVFEMTVEKYAPDGSFLDRFFYTGVMGQLGAGLGVPGAAFSEDAATVFSPIEYNAEDIEGKAMLFTATADIATPVGGSVNKTEFAFFGGEGIPPLIVDVSDSFADPNVLIGFEAGVGIEFGAGFVFDRTPVTQVSENFRFTQELAAFSAADDLEFQSSFDFGFDESNLTDCGRQYLREFVAEHRALFAIPDVHVAIFGFADTKGTETYNLGLSQDRANTVRNALLNILGGQLPIIPDNIAAIGLGEAPARIDLQGGDPDAPPWLDLILDQPEEFKWRSAALAAKDLSARIPDDTDDPEWRRAVIVLNGLVKISLESPLVDKP